MKAKRYVVLVAVLCYPFRLTAQTGDDPKFRVFGGYSYFLTADNPDNNFEFVADGRETLHGFAEVARDLNGSVGIVADVSRQANNFETAGIPVRHFQASLWSFLFGPQVAVPNHRLRPFGQALIGGARSHISTPDAGDIIGFTGTEVFTKSDKICFGSWWRSGHQCWQSVRSTGNPRRLSADVFR